MTPHFAALIVFSLMGIVSSSYMILYMDEECRQLFRNERANIYVDGTAFSTSSVILKATRTPPYSKWKNCTVNIIPYNTLNGVVLSIREVDFPYFPSYCSDYIEIYDGSILSPIKECGFSLDYNELQTFSKFKNISFLYHTGSSATTEKGFEIIATAYSLTPCLLNEFQCSNNRCIYDGLKCDGHNNCGDNSDEGIALCDTFINDGNSFRSSWIVVCFGVLACVVIVTFLALVCMRIRRQQAVISSFRPQPELPPYHSAYPGYSISQNPAGPNLTHAQGVQPQGDGGFSNPCYAANYPGAPPPYKP